MTVDGIVAYKREAKNPDEVAMVFLNFSDAPKTVFIPFPEVGTYQEMIDRDATPPPPDIVVTGVNQTQRLDLPSHSGRIYLK